MNEKYGKEKGPQCKGGALFAENAYFYSNVLYEMKCHFSDNNTLHLEIYENRSGKSRNYVVANK